MIHISETANDILKNAFPDTRIFTRQGRTYGAVDAHPDMYMCAFRDGTVDHADLSEIGENYPQNIAYNAVCLDKYFIHNLKYTSPKLLNEAQDHGLIPVNVRQGYTKCSCVVVNGNSIITSDEGIYKTLSTVEDIDVLKIREGHVNLDGFAYGFLGGTSGLVGNELVFAGNITKHPDYAKIYEFCMSKNVKIRYFDFPLQDIGSIIEEK